MFSPSEIEQFSSKGIDARTIEKQIHHFKTGFPFAELTEPATISNGIRLLGQEEINQYTDKYDQLSRTVNILKFVPASGAATRMFKQLFTFKEHVECGNDPEVLLADKSFNSIHHFLNDLEKFAFYNDLSECMKKDGLSISDCIKNKNYTAIIDYVLFEKGLNYSNLPKALLKFHQYGNISRTAIEEHLVESANYCKDKDNVCAVHFTISPEHKDKFTELVESVKTNYEKAFNVLFNISYSFQNPATDTIAVNMENDPVKEKDGKLVFRPAGHGALIDNLNAVDAEVVFIKNIDNIVPDRLKDETYRYKKALGGMLLELYHKIKHYLELIETGNCSNELLVEIAGFAERELFIKADAGFDYMTFQHKCDYLFGKMNRPIRICGMVKNEGEPGGGPFWVRKNANSVSLQIVETSQINLQNHEQSNILKASTHFNPVDLVCCMIDCTGKKFNLHNFVDPETGFISIKSKDGKDIKAMELPGLWNGAMADWITIFVEVPLITFNPVKTVNDLLRKEHQ
jgi:hypothetical protein